MVQRRYRSDSATLETTWATPEVRLTLTEAMVGEVAGGRTSMTVTEFGYADEQVRDQSKAGLEQCLDKMAALLEK